MALNKRYELCEEAASLLSLDHVLHSLIFHQLINIGFIYFVLSIFNYKAYSFDAFLCFYKIRRISHISCQIINITDAVLKPL